MSKRTRRAKRLAKRAERNRNFLAAAGDQSQLTLTGNVQITAAAEGEGDKRPTFHIDAYSGDPIRVGNFFSPVIVDLGGLKASRERLPILLDHDPSQIVGQSSSVTIGASGVSLDGSVTGDDEPSRRVTTHAKNGFEWQASIGANIDRREFLEPGKTTTVNGRSVSGPMVIAREATLMETSFVAIGADQKSSATVAASQSQGVDMNFNEWLAAKGFDPDNISDSAKTFLKAQFDAEQNPDNGGGGSGGSSGSSGSSGRTQPADPNFDNIIAKKRENQQRIDDITRIASQYLDDHPREIESVEALARLAIEGNWTTERFELDLLRQGRPTGGFQFRRPEQEKLTGRVIEAALCQTGGYSTPQLEKEFDEQTLEAAHKRYPHGLGLGELLLTFANANGRERHLSTNNVRGILQAAFSTDVRASGFSTLSLPGILANTANKFLLMGWMAVDSTWSRISSRRSVSDFKTITSYSLNGAFQYEKLGPAGEIKHGELGETAYTNKADTYARMFAITRQDIINDDLGALTATPRRLGRGGALALNDVFWTIFLDNSSFWTAGNGTRKTGSGSELGDAALTAAEVAFMNLTDPDGKPLALMPEILLVPPSEKTTALALMNSQLIVNGGTNTTVPNANVWQGRFRVESSPYMENSAYTGNSSTAWYLLADPNDISAIEVVFLNGKETPTVESAEADFNTLGIQMRGYHDFGVAKQEYRAGIANDGE